MTTRSTKLAVVTPAVNTNTPAYASPSGFRTILKSILVTSFSGTGATVSVILNDLSGGGYLNVVRTVTQPYTPIEWTGWVMMHPGDAIDVQTDQSPTTFWLSGSQLPTP